MLKVFEAFSGVGAQRMALRNIRIKYEIVATSEIDINAIIAYYNVHCNERKLSVEEENKNKEEKIKYLLDKNIGNEKLYKLKNIKIDELYRATKLMKNLGDISRIREDEIPEHDLFTYSFPCQDISTLGTQKGLSENSGTRSSLLWECKRIIESARPKYLLLENVKNLVMGKNKENFLKWVKYLENQGYQNQWEIVDSQNYGIPQRRPRVIMISKLGAFKKNFFEKNNIKMKNIDDILDFENKEYDILELKAPLKGKTQKKYFFIDDRDWKINGIMINDVCSTQRAGRTGLKCGYKDENQKIYARKLTGLECCRLMGYDDSDYFNMKKSLTDNNILKICGNSIVVNVLENILKNIEKEKN